MMLNKGIRIGEKKKTTHTQFQKDQPRGGIAGARVAASGHLRHKLGASSQTITPREYTSVLAL
jgi:hypothetical protein